VLSSQGDFAFLRCWCRLLRRNMVLKPMKRLRINLDEVVEAMDNIDRDTIDFYLDTQTGDVLPVNKDFLDEILDEEEETANEWEAEARELARKIEEDEGEQYEWIPKADSSEAYRLMEDFIDTVPDPKQRKRLAEAIAGKGAFRRFKDTLLDYPATREKWFEFEEIRKRQWAREWLEDLEIVTTWKPSKPEGKSEWPQAILALDHLAIPVPPGKIDDARKFYGGILGLEETTGSSKPGKQDSAWFRVGELRIRFYAGQAEGGTPFALTFQVTQLPRWEACLKQHGIAIAQRDRPPRLARLEFTDPFGNRIELVEALPESD